MSTVGKHGGSIDSTSTRATMAALVDVLSGYDVDLYVSDVTPFQETKTKWGVTVSNVETQ